jgi:hypothetical protein
MVTLGKNLLGVPKIGQREPFLPAGFEDVKDDEQFRVLDIDDGPVPIIAPAVILEPCAAVIEVFEGQEIESLVGIKVVHNA